MTTTAPSDPFGAVAAGARHRAYRELACTGPVHRLVLPTGVPAWLITGYQHVRAALNDARLVKFAASPTAALMQRERPDLARAMDTNMICCDGPEHARLRGLVGAVFTRRRIEAFAPASSKSSITCWVPSTGAGRRTWSPDSPTRWR